MANFPHAPSTFLLTVRKIGFKCSILAQNVNEQKTILSAAVASADVALFFVLHGTPNNRT
jgi:hypothetical protein